MKTTRTFRMALAAGVLAVPVLAFAGGNSHGGVPHVLGDIKQQVTEINSKIGNLDADNDNPLLTDILSELQGLQ